MLKGPVVIKLLDNPDNPKLKMKYIGAIEYVTPGQGKDGKVITGLDEDAFDVLSIPDQKEREKVRKAIQKEREELEKLLGVKLDPHSSYWTNFYVPLSDEDIAIDQSNATDRIKERFLIANKVVAPSREAIDLQEEFMNCIYYLHREAEENTKRVTKQKEKDKAKSELYLLQEKNANKLKITGAYIFGFDVDDLDAETVYLKLSDYLDVTDTDQAKINIQTFLEAIKKTPEQMQIKIILDKAVRKRIVKVKAGIYRRGDKILGNNYDDTLLNLESVEQNGELASLIKEVEEIKK